MAWRRPGDKPLSEPMMVSLPTHICVTRPQWVNSVGSGADWAIGLFSLWNKLHSVTTCHPYIQSATKQIVITIDYRSLDISWTHKRHPMPHSYGGCGQFVEERSSERSPRVHCTSLAAITENEGFIWKLMEALRGVSSVRTGIIYHGDKIQLLMRFGCGCPVITRVISDLSQWNGL